MSDGNAKEGGGGQPDAREVRDRVIGSWLDEERLTARGLLDRIPQFKPGPLSREIFRRLLRRVDDLEDEAFRYVLEPRRLLGPSSRQALIALGLATRNASFRRQALQKAPERKPSKKYEKALAAATESALARDDAAGLIADVSDRARQVIVSGCQAALDAATITLTEGPQGVFDMWQASVEGLPAAEPPSKQVKAKQPTGATRMAAAGPPPGPGGVLETPRSPAAGVQGAKPMPVADLHVAGRLADALRTGLDKAAEALQKAHGEAAAKLAEAQAQYADADQRVNELRLRSDRFQSNAEALAAELAEIKARAADGFKAREKLEIETERLQGRVTELKSELANQRSVADGAQQTMRGLDADLDRRLRVKAGGTAKRLAKDLEGRLGKERDAVLGALDGLGDELPPAVKKLRSFAKNLALAVSTALTAVNAEAERLDEGDRENG